MPSSPYTQTCHSATPSLGEPGMPGKDKGAGRQMQCVAWTQVGFRRTAANGLSDLPRHNPRDEESREDDRPFHRDVCYRRLSSRTARTRGVFHIWPSLQGNLLCRSDWLGLRPTAETECAIFPIRELARCSACEHLRPGERPSARRSLPCLSTNSAGSQFQ